MKQVELLAPAGNYEALEGAICAGADAVYLAGNHFGARAYADNFTEEELCKGIRMAHIYGRRIYLTVNILVKEAELPELVTFLRPLYEAGLDGRRAGHPALLPASSGSCKHPDDDYRSGGCTLLKGTGDLQSGSGKRTFLKRNPENQGRNRN